MAFSAQDLLWLLLPLAAASGWLVARHDQRRHPNPRDKGLSSDYFRGINYLLNEQPDKAIEVFMRMLEVNTDTVETHLALGVLFRRRGEVERAIRIHQNLIARPTLDKTQRSQALCELALDYHKAGLLDRAESLFLELAEVATHADQALRSLMHIYEQEKEWDKAITVGRRLGRHSDVVAPILAQYQCELAEQALADGNVSLARREIEGALALDPRCVRASLLAGQVALRTGRESEALAAWQRIEQQDAMYLDEVMEQIVAAYRRANDEQGLYLYLQGVMQRCPGVRTLLTLADVIGRRNGIEAAIAFVTTELHKMPSVAGLQHLTEMHLQRPGPVSHDDLDLFKSVLDQMAAQQQGYQCRQCGFRGRTLRWQCPACSAWISMQPLSRSAGAGQAGDATPIDPDVAMLKRVRK
jgi:lipopolysaccharide biosynthesis regulator YciM